MTTANLNTQVASYRTDVPPPISSHHEEQRLADDAGFIGGVHKNHPANLMALCERCHREEHSTAIPHTKKVVKKKTTKGIVVKDGV